MTPWRSFCETLHLIALAIWLGVVLAAGATAAIVFPAMKALSPRLPEFAAYSGDHWPIAGGSIMLPVFTFADLVQFICSMLAAVTLLASVMLLKADARRPAFAVRTLALAIAIASLASLLIIITPRFNSAVHRFWDAARAGDAAAAATHRAAADELHPLASRMLVVTAVSVLVALVAGVRCMMPRAGSGGVATARPSRYEQPALLKGVKR